MLHGLWKLTWLEIKIFLREPLGAFGSIILPVLVFVVVGRFMGGRLPSRSIATSEFVRVGLPVFVSVLIALSGVLSLVTIVSIYREGDRKSTRQNSSHITISYAVFCLKQ